MTAYKRKQLLADLSSKRHGFFPIPSLLDFVAKLPTTTQSVASNQPFGEPPMLNNDDDLPGPEDFGRIRFCHVRFYFDYEKSACNPKGISGKGGATIAFRRRNDQKEIEYAITLCNRKDNFNRRLGRLISSNLLDGDRKHIIITSPEEQDSYFLKNVMVPKAINKLGAKNFSGLGAAEYNRMINKVIR